MKLFKFEIQKCGLSLCVHKPYFLMPGYNLTRAHVMFLAHVMYTNIYNVLRSFLL